MRTSKNKLLPRLMTVPQFASKCGKSPRWVRDACEEGRIPAAQWVVDRWIIPEGALIRVRHTDMSLPPEMIGEPYPEPEYKGGKGAKPLTEPNVPKLIKLPGSEAYTRARRTEPGEGLQANRINTRSAEEWRTWQQGKS